MRPAPFGAAAASSSSLSRRSGPVSGRRSQRRTSRALNLRRSERMSIVFIGVCGFKLGYVKTVTVGARTPVQFIMYPPALQALPTCACSKLTLPAAPVISKLRKTERTCEHAHISKLEYRERPPFDFRTPLSSSLGRKDVVAIMISFRLRSLATSPTSTDVANPATANRKRTTTCPRLRPKVCSKRRQTPPISSAKTTMSEALWL